MTVGGATRSFLLLMVSMVQPLAAEPPVSGQPLAPNGSAYMFSNGVSTNRFPAGVADVFGNGPYDVFISLERLHPFVEFDVEGAPVYGPVQAVGNGSGNGRLIMNTGNEIYGLFWSSKTLSVRRFDKGTLTFVGNSSRSLALPGNIQSAAALFRPDGRLLVGLTIGNGESNTPPAPPEPDAANYRPYDGAQRWRGGLPSFDLYTVVFPSLSLGVPGPVNPAFDGDAVFFSQNLGLTFLAPPVPTSSISYLVGTDKGGAVRLFTVNESGVVVGDRGMVPGPEGLGLIHRTIQPNATSTASHDGGWGDLFVGDTGRLWYYKFSGNMLGPLPTYETPIPVRIQGREHRLGDLPVISPGDIDGDGLVDLLGGNDGGHLFWMRNIGSAQAPEFDVPRFLDVDGEDLIIRPGPTGSLQGPGESAWGYTCPTLYDWNHDGLPDVILSSSLGTVEVLLQRDRTGAKPTFDAPTPIYCDGIPLAITWRQQVAATDWGIPGNDQLVTFDEHDRLRVYPQVDDVNVTRGEGLNLDNGSPILANVNFSGQYGRTKLQAVDWDQDGRMDLIAGVRRWHSIPDPVNGLPQVVGSARESGALFLKNTGTNANPTFDFPESFEFDGELIRLGVHSASAAAVNLGLGYLDLLIAEETGSIMYYSREDLTP